MNSLPRPSWPLSDEVSALEELVSLTDMLDTSWIAAQCIHPVQATRNILWPQLSFSTFLDDQHGVVLTISISASWVSLLWFHTEGNLLQWWVATSEFNRVWAWPPHSRAIPSAQTVTPYSTPGQWQLQFSTVKQWRENWQAETNCRLLLQMGIPHRWPPLLKAMTIHLCLHGPWWDETRSHNGIGWQQDGPLLQPCSGQGWDALFLPKYCSKGFVVGDDHKWMTTHISVVIYSLLSVACNPLASTLWPKYSTLTSSEVLTES